MATIGRGEGGRHEYAAKCDVNGAAFYFSHDHNSAVIVKANNKDRK